MPKTLGSCASCGYPGIAASGGGQRVTCPYCRSINESITQNVGVPTWLVAGGIGLFMGVVFGQAMVAGTERSARWLGEKARR